VDAEHLLGNDTGNGRLAPSTSVETATESMIGDASNVILDRDSATCSVDRHSS
jgi:hypothetical protein